MSLDASPVALSHSPLGDHPGDELGVHTIGLAPQANGLGIVAGILGIEQEDQKAELVTASANTS